MKKAILCIWIFLIFALLCQPVYAADDYSGPWERFSITLGAFLPSLDSDLRLGSSALGSGIDVNLEEALGFDTTTTVFRVGALYRIGDKRRHRIAINYFDIRRGGEKTLEQDLPDYDFLAGDVVTSFLNLKIFKLDYGYSFFMDDRMNLALTAGLYVMPFETGLKVEGVGDERADFTAPLPVFGLNFDFAITPKWILLNSFEVFYLEYQDFKGSILDTSLSIEYHPWTHWAFGLGVDAFQLGIEADGEDYPGIDFVGDMTFGYLGLALYAKYQF